MRERPDTDMARMLGVLNGGEVARRLNVTRTAVSEWSYAADPPLTRIIQVRQLLLDALGHKEAAAPDWERLMRTVDAIAVRVGATLDEEQRAVDAAVAELGSPPGAETLAAQPVDDRAVAAPRNRSG